MKILSYIEAIKAIEYLISTPYLSHEEGIAIIREIKNDLPGVSFEGAHKATIETLRRRIADAVEYLSEDLSDHKRQAAEAEAHEGRKEEAVLSPSGEEDAVLAIPVAQSGSAVPRKKGRATKGRRTG